ncbi:hypothetical protein [Pseudooceanicola sp.]|uniref:hypothetical protein n=1 Tax=Pseudooceanicola sp. TaxID=1914328 RepID=UPI0035C68D62
MTNPRWHILREDSAVTIARQLPVRFDLAVTARFAAPHPVSLTALAHQIRQDIWRALQRLRGFSPVVRVAQAGAAIAVEAGGRCAGPTGGAADRIAMVLDSPSNRQRWLAHARRRT